MPRIFASRTSCFVVAAIAALLLPGQAFADHHEESVADQIKAVIHAGNAFTQENLTDQESTTSRDGSLEFWSSGGLLQWSEADAPGSKYDAFSIDAKHIKVIELPGGEAAVAMYYSEGTMKVEGRPAVGHYMTRVLQVFVKEDGKWVARAGHWSPIAAGSGTNQSSLD